MKSEISINRSGQLVRPFRNILGFNCHEIINGTGMIEIYESPAANNMDAWMMMESYFSTICKIDHYADKSEFLTMKNTFRS